MSTHVSGSPFQDMPDVVSAMLKAAGWRPGARRVAHASPCRSGIAGRPWREFVSKCAKGALLPLDLESCAVSRASDYEFHILDELFGVCVHPRSGEVSTSTVMFDSYAGVIHLDLCARLGRLLNRCFIPIGEVRSEAVILCGEDHSIYLLGIVCFGVHFAGESFGAAMENLFLSRRLPIVEVEGPGSEDFRWR